MNLTEKVADLRRTAPAESANRWQQTYLSQAQDKDLEFDEQQKLAVKQTEEEGKVDLGDLERWDEVRDTWDKGTEELLSLKGGLTETVARLERAKTVVGYMQGR